MSIDFKEYTVAEADHGIRLDRWFKRYLPGVPHGLLEKSLRNKLIRLNGKKADASARVEAGQVIAVAPSLAVEEAPRKIKPAAEKPSDTLLAQLQKAVLYEDDELLILSKPPGLAVQGGSGQRVHLDAALPYLSKGAALKLVHRLDKDTSGVLALAKGAKAAAKLAALFAGKEVEKIYLALVIGVPSPLQGRIDIPLLKESRGKDSGVTPYEKVGENRERGQRAITEYRVLDALGKKLAWVELRPITGRTHQLRVHMDSIDCPIIGDGKYGGSDVFLKDLGLPQKLHLHAQRLIIPNWKGKRLDVSAPLPAHMKESKRLLGE